MAVGDNDDDAPRPDEGSGQGAEDAPRDGDAPRDDDAASGGPDGRGERDGSGERDGAGSGRGAPLYPGWEQLGEFIRAQRKMMELSQRELAKLTKVSDPYVSQLERGLHEPSVRVLKSLADALNVRAETLLSYAGLLEPDPEASTGVEEAIGADPHLTNDQKQTLLSVYRNFRGPVDEV
ncbi:MAG: helix-turn-helix transcriptional regulator [Actinomycetota bacterium]